MNLPKYYFRKRSYIYFSQKLMMFDTIYASISKNIYKLNYKNQPCEF